MCGRGQKGRGFKRCLSRARRGPKRERERKRECKTLEGARGGRGKRENATIARAHPHHSGPPTWQHPNLLRHLGQQPPVHDPPQRRLPLPELPEHLLHRRHLLDRLRRQQRLPRAAQLHQNQIRLDAKHERARLVRARLRRVRGAQHVHRAPARVGGRRRDVELVQNLGAGRGRRR